MENRTISSFTKGPFSEEWKKLILRCMYLQWTERKMCDTTIQCSDGETHAPSFVLTSCIPFFKDVLIECGDRKTVHRVVKSSSSAVVWNSLIGYLFTGIISLPDDQLQQFYELVTFLQLDLAQMACNMHIDKSNELNTPEIAASSIKAANCDLFSSLDPSLYRPTSEKPNENSASAVDDENRDLPDGAVEASPRTTQNLQCSLEPVVEVVTSDHSADGPTSASSQEQLPVVFEVIECDLDNILGQSSDGERPTSTNRQENSAFDLSSVNGGLHNVSGQPTDSLTFTKPQQSSASEFEVENKKQPDIPEITEIHVITEEEAYESQKKKKKKKKKKKT